MRLRGAATVVAAVVAISMIPAAGALAESGEEAYYKDRFQEVSYSQNDGTLDFAGPWVEIGDDGSAASGNVHVAGDGQCSGNKCVHIEGGLLSSLGLRRPADTSVFVDAELSYELEIDNILLLSDSTLYVQASKNGSSWTTLKSYHLASSEGHHEDSVDLDGFLSKNFSVRFLVAGIFGGQVYLDEVKINGTLIPPPTTTTSSTSTTSSTTTTTAPTTTSTSNATSTTERPTTSSSSTTSTTRPRNTTTSADGIGGESTTTTIDDSSSTTVAPVGTGSGGPPTGSGLRQTAVGLMVDYESGMSGDVSPQVEVLSAEVTADYSLAAETFESARYWIVLLSLLIAMTVLSGVDSRRMRKTAHAAPHGSA